MKANKLLVLAAAALAFVSCNNTTTAPKYLVLYYSQTGETEAVAQEIAGQLGVEAVSFDVENPYTGTFEETIERCITEKKDSVSNTLVPLTVDPADYDVIFLGYPIWFGTYAAPVEALLAEYDFAGKTVVPFCTFGSGGLESSVADLRAACPEAEVTDGYGIRSARVDNAASYEVTGWLLCCGYVEGEAPECPEYGEEHECTEEEVEVFNTACGDYEFPIGTPTTVCSRETEHGTDYIYNVTTKGPDGEEGTAQV
ncbi:MAG: hypothetical protein LUC24_02070, partial [Bacteroidales bacterium]|nr:hypothetical protein [Bacteroidales bacterium]